MTFKEAEELKAGDQVYWTDPDEGLCSRVINIKTVKVKGEFVFLADADGSEVEAFPHELSFVN